MFNVGGGEMIAIFLLALIVLGPERLPKAMGQVGRAVAQMRKLSSGFQDEIRRAMDPIEAPFRPGEQTLPGPMPAVTDEVKVVNTEKPASTASGAAASASSSGPSGIEGLDPELVPSPAPLGDAPRPVALDKPAAVALDTPAAVALDKPAAVALDTPAGGEPAPAPAEATVVEPVPSSTGSVTPLRPQGADPGPDGDSRATG